MWGSPVEVERRNRIRLCAYAYAYEIDGEPLVSDMEFDHLASKIKPEVRTGHRRIDKFFRDEFADYTGQWIHKHPELPKVEALVKRLRNNESVGDGE